MDSELCRIGELAERTGVSAHTLRAWEKRFGLLRPVRTSSGYRLYSAQDAARVTHMQELRQAGVSADQAASRVLAGERLEPDQRETEGSDPADLIESFVAHVAAWDDAGAHAVLNRAFADRSVEEAVEQVVLPAMRAIGAGWADGTLSVAQEHFASALVRSRLMPLALAWPAGDGPLAVLACPPQERHDLGLLCFGVLLGRAGWRIRYLGADTPWDSLASTTEELRPQVVVLSSIDRTRLAPLRGELKRLRGAQMIAVGGSGAQRLRGVMVLPDQPSDAVSALAHHRAGLPTGATGRSIRSHATSSAPPAKPASQTAR